MNFAVIFSYSYDDDMAVYTFETEEEAVSFLRDSYEEEIRIDVEENGYKVNAKIRQDGWRASITDCFEDHKNTTFFAIAPIYQ